MIVVRFKMQVQPDKVEQARAALVAAIAPSRGVAGAIHFDIAQDLANPNAFIATEVFTDREALARQEALPVIQEIIACLPDWLAGEPEATIFHVSSSEPWG